MTRVSITSDGLELEGYLAIPERRPVSGAPGLVICHGFPTRALHAERAGHSYHSLADRIAADRGQAAMVLHYRGCSESEGNFSLGGWMADVQMAIDTLADRPEVASVSVLGFGTGGALAIAAAARRKDVRAVAAVAPPADFADWSGSPERLLDHARYVGAIRDEDFPADLQAWTAELSAISAADAAAELSPRPLLLIHGNDDEVVPVFDSRIVADAHGSAELRVIQGAGHLLRYDPRAVAILLGWLDRQGFSGRMV